MFCAYAHRYTVVRTKSNSTLSLFEHESRLLGHGTEAAAKKVAFKTNTLDSIYFILYIQHHFLQHLLFLLHLFVFLGNGRSGKT